MFIWVPVIASNINNNPITRIKGWGSENTTKGFYDDVVAARRILEDSFTSYSCIVFLAKALPSFI